MNILAQLKEMTKIVADTGDFKAIEKFKPIDSTTNPSLIYAAALDDKYAYLIDDAIEFAEKNESDSTKRTKLCMDRLAVNFGREILNIIPGRVSTEVDARLSFDTETTISRAKEMIDLYEAAGIDRKRILIKIAATWEGIRAVEVLEKEDYRCNLTLLFSLPQAIASADAGVTLISPFVGRIYDWHKKARGVDSIPAEEDPGVLSVKNIFNYYKKFNYATEIMGASFRNTGEIIELAGCDLLTISPKLMDELENMEGDLQRKLSETEAKNLDTQRIPLDEKKFRWMVNEDQMATEKLSEGIRRFTADLIKLEKFVIEKITK